MSVRMHPPQVYTAPAELPLTMADAKRHLRQDLDDDDQVILALIRLATDYVQDLTGLRLLSQTVDLSLDAFPSGDCLPLPVRPVTAVTSITSYGLDGSASTFSSSAYRLDTYAVPNRIVLVSGASWPTAVRDENAALIRVVAGYSTRDSMPAAVRQAMLLLLAHYYENREPVLTSGAQGIALPWTIDALLSPYRAGGFA